MLDPENGDNQQVVSGIHFRWGRLICVLDAPRFVIPGADCVAAGLRWRDGGFATSMGAGSIATRYERSLV
ncbi:MAG: hypothetical protein ACREXR_19680 [Gammaproteobacteria bacterium]